MDWTGLGGMTVTPFLISIHCSTVDTVSRHHHHIRLINDLSAASIK